MATDQTTPDPKRLLQDALAKDPAQDSPWAAPTVITLAPHFPDLEILDLVGRGGMAAVYKAIQKKLGRTVALKILRPDLATQKEFVDRFLREARALAALAHPHVLTVHDFGESAGFCYLITEFVDGANLRELMELGPVSPAEVLRLVPQICAGLQYAHEHGVVHRDIKPENVLVDRHGQVKLVDFGLAKLRPADGEQTLTRESMVFGTPRYMAPEQWRSSKAVDHRADIYSLGVVLYELLTGSLPVGAYPPPSESQGVPKGIDAVVDRSLQQEPERRYQSAGEVRRDVERESRQVGSAAALATAAQEGDPGGRGALWLLVLAITLLLVSGLGFTLFSMDEMRAQAQLHYGAGEAAEVVRAIRAKVSTGAAWTERTESHSRDTWAVRGPLPPGVGPTVVAAWILATLLLVSLLGIGARSRLSDAGRAWRAAASVVAWLPWVALFDTAVVGALAMVGAFLSAEARWVSWMLALVLILSTNVSLTLWLWQRGRTRRSPTSANWPKKIVFRLAAAAATLALVASMITPFAFPRITGGVLMPARAELVIGSSRAEVIAGLGPPESIQLSQGGMQWTYLDLQGRTLQGAVQFAGNRVTGVADPAAVLVPGIRPDRGPYLGQSRGELTMEMGGAILDQEGDRTTLHFVPSGVKVVTFQDVVVEILK